MTADQDGLVIVGASLAGASAATGAREAGFRGRIVLLGAESHAPYERPGLSKGYLAGGDDRASLDVHPAEWYDEHEVQLRLGTRVTAIDPAAHTVRLAGGEELRYWRALLATGSSPRRLAVPGGDAEGVHVLRTVEDADALRAAIGGGDARVVVLGSGWIGMEVAATARSAGNDVTVLARAAVPLAAPLGAEVGSLFARLHERHGVVLRTGTAIERVLVEDGRASGVVLAGGETVPADVVVVGHGATPALELARAAGLAIGDGVLVDASLRTSVPDVFAAGDIANVLHPLTGTRIRSEHWANALAGGTAAGRAMAGEEVVYDDVPYFYTDQFDLSMEYAGFSDLARDAETIYRGDPDSPELIVFWRSEGRVVAAMNVNVWDVSDTLQALIRSRAVVDPARLADPSVDLGDLAS